MDWIVMLTAPVGFLGVIGGTTILAHWASKWQ